MPDNNKIEEFLQKLASCIERGEHEACVEEVVRLAGEMGVGAGELLDLSVQKGMGGMHAFAYVLTLAAAQGLEGEEKAGAYYNAGVAAQFLGKLKEAEEQYKKAIEVNPKYAVVHNNYAILLYELNRKEEAEEHFKKAIEVNPKHVSAHYNYAILLYELNRKEEAEEHFKKAIEVNPKYADAHYNYAILLYELNRKEEAEEHYKKAIEINPEFLLALYNYANILREKRQLLKAEENVRKVLQIDPENPYALVTLGDILADEDSFEEAIKEYQKALKNSASMKHSTTAEIHNNLGWAYTQLKQYNKAEEEFKKALVFDPLNVKANRNLRKLGKVVIEPEISKIQKYLAAVLVLPLMASYYLFWISKLSETIFAAQSIFLIALLVFILLYHQMAKVKIGAIEFEKSVEHRLMEAKNKLITSPPDFER